jgi:hypothetical protein
MILTDIVQTCVACPSQWDARTTDGRKAYVRYRHWGLTVEITEHDGSKWTAVDRDMQGTWTADGHCNWLEVQAVIADVSDQRPNEDDPERERGLSSTKWSARRADGSSAPGRKHATCETFVLDFGHDRFALPAMEAYVAACRESYPQLAQDLDRKLAEMRRRFT